MTDLISLAHSSATQAADGSQGLWSMLLMMGAALAVFYVLLWRPQRRQQTEHQTFLGALKKGDEVILRGGVYGRIAGVENDTFLVEVAQGVRLKVMRQSVSTRAPTALPVQSASAVKVPEPAAADAGKKK